MNELEKDIRHYYNYTNGKRVKYRDYTQMANVAVSVLYPMSAFFVALSFKQNLQECMKMASLLSGTIGTIIPLVAREAE